ncbi:sodium:proton antiporter NhaD [Rubripirellula reticaptiva]|uniref:Na(+)/H(+) antiporter NhaD n=1 Tax=Rubripirellula reticaptiva TaxID=2528013 RepID=A0A5C6F572_9BACT|nr:sodium:proton antiporter NhaD [Rubripirellula reticaptiva]TWU56355.1 Na(+)/H(+) antiporter NhaD [Rubripirellula reticaptiva]
MLTLILIVFVLGYLAIAFEHKLKINKAASALFIGVVCWSLYVVNLPDLLPRASIPSWFEQESVQEEIVDVPLHFAIDAQHLHQTGEIASILFFLMGAMTIVELVDAHEGFALITDRIRTRDKRTLLWTVGLLTFFLSAILDNLTTTIVMVSLLRKLVADREDRLRFVGMVVIAANAGGAWTVIGDVTTTMLWIKHKLGTVEVMGELFLGSLVCLLVPLLGFSRSMKGAFTSPVISNSHVAKDIRPWHQWLFLILGLIGLLGVPVFKTFTHLPPYMGMMLSLSVLWGVSELVGHTLDEQTRSSTGVLAALRRVDMSSILFFLGILLAVGSLGATGTLQSAAVWLDSVLPNRDIVAVVIGLVSSVVDNVPLVAAGIEMYDLPVNDPFWMLLAYCAGTGGSCLIIGSAAGVAAMGLEHIDFVWYFKRIAPWALAGYIAGAVVVVIQLSIT